MTTTVIEPDVDLVVGELGEELSEQKLLNEITASMTNVPSLSTFYCLTSHVDVTLLPKA